MAFDGIFTHVITDELNSALVSGRISKIHQPYKQELMIHIRAHGKNHKLFISAHPSYARIHLTNETYENPSEPPMFCMLLRKHLEGGFIEKVEQMELDRIIIFTIKSRNEIGDESYKQLIVEIMGRHSNIILLDRDKQVILDSIKHVSPAVNRHRTVLPGQPYIAPPVQEKLHPFEVDEEAILKKINFNSGKIDQQIVEQFAGISPLFAREVTYRAGLVNRGTLPDAFLSLIALIKQKEYTPIVIVSAKKEHFYMIDLQHIEGERKVFSSFSEMLDRFYYGKAERDRVKQQGNDLERFISNERNKNSKKIKKLKQTLDDAGKADRYKLFGELVTANMYSITRGTKEIDVINYYTDDQETITIPLNPQKSASENAQQFFQKYQKAKNSISIVEEQIEKTEAEVAYFDTLYQQIESASPKDLQEIREELIEEGYLKGRQHKNKKTQKPQKTVIEKYTSSDGTEILVGKNNKQNEFLTNKLASRDDIWLHTKDIPGSHVVIRSKTPSDETILEAANLAAYFSKAKHSASVPVDYTLIRHVKKPNGSKPGYVIYDNQNTVYVTPDEDLVLRLRG
ncbi:NFACT family protein [Bacillus sp. PS06]|uniref:Rqc2 family fibronectin-binding protein n=1 Tax=Bacillus sp. PS06 TaxID=2764176 RepID=UPI00177AFA71|nr:NFACT RNA binding domain-containing protein [Bacillus sp. PS06]MBD8068358.1 NFACT family protein [Bacillus sp. PS06]